ncbi:hypothetical protein CANCADRAFT_58439 [Tortispora caseinolytica NRRL Y-17796]|uniref:SSD domain-containing protein n=1 Tax=Tortispora caseinolytica NRRL Y-17796 TaxID=767744 RepID=A0A1E4TCQ4_9ASCO|nr:hypothetical protein CANCADRAFT_58439 [Tortispora caseinolytica NRRL Y-17796]
MVSGSLMWLYLLTCLFTFALATEIHSKGVCADRDVCGKKSLWGSELPCPDNGNAETPDDALRDDLVDLCGPKWFDMDVCCVQSQVDQLRENFKKVEPLLSACPACKANFFDLFCHMTCSPDQSTFINVTQIGKSTTGLDIVTEMSVYVSPKQASEFYDSCKDVKFSSMNGRVMDLIGGGAQNYSAFLKFLGDEKPLLGGSPFQINFRYETDIPGMHLLSNPVHPCNDSDPTFRCSCSDCPDVCPELPWKTPIDKTCKVGLLHCFSFGVIVLYASILVLVVIGYAMVLYCKEHGIIDTFDHVQLLQEDEYPDYEEDLVFDAGDIMDGSSYVYPVNTFLSNWFGRLGFFCANYAIYIIIGSLVLVGALSSGIAKFTVEDEPVNLWVGPRSSALQEKEYFDRNFGPFYRIEQIFLASENESVMSYENLAWWFEVEQSIVELTASNGDTFDNFCLKPMGDACVIQSFTQYFNGDIDNFQRDSYKQSLIDCTDSPVQCLPPFMQPLDPKIVFGYSNFTEDKSVLDSDAIVATFIVSNSEAPSYIERVTDWETELEKFLLNKISEAKARGLSLSLSTESSLKKELNQSGNTDIKIVVVSYLVMLCYVSLTLGRRSLFNLTSLAWIINSRALLGFVGVIIVVMSISMSIGFFSLFGVKMTLIVAEVIPFLVLAIGVDNIFLLVHELNLISESYNAETVEYRVSRALARVGPSIFLSTLSETITFLIATIVDMPAVRNFAIYAAGAVIANAWLQLTFLIAVISLDQRRLEARRVDCFPCIQLLSGVTEDYYPYTLSTFIRKYYAPLLLKKATKLIVVLFFFTGFIVALMCFPDLQLGLDQRLALPDTSYLIPYFNDLNEYFRQGPPVYFVVREGNITYLDGQQKLCGSFSSCSEFSLVNILEQESKRPKISYIADSPASWLDTYLHWLNPELDQFCFKDHPWSINMTGMPERDEFMNYLKLWLDASPDPCPLGGKAAFGNAVVPNYVTEEIIASHFRTFHTTLKSQSDYINAYKSARTIADHAGAMTGLDVFPYSVFYIFFDQYLNIQKLSIQLISLAVSLLIIITAFFIGSLISGLILGMTVIMIIVDIVGVMSVWGVSLNAMSLVNLVICVGISVEFCVHICRSFMYPNTLVLDLVRGRIPARDKRVISALASVGGSVLDGITMTKLIGIIVLAFTRSKIYEVYYFRVWLALIVLAAVHALIFLPVLLSVLGSETGYQLEDEEDSLQQDLMNRQYRSVFLDDSFGDDFN